MPQMRMLFLDDEPYRHDLANRRHGERYIIDHVDTAFQAIEALKSGRYDAISLDHDLSADHYEGLGLESGTGVEVARYIVTMRKEDRPAIILVHSLSEKGSMRIFRTFYDAGIRAVRDDLFSGVASL